MSPPWESHCCSSSPSLRRGYFPVSTNLPYVIGIGFNGFSGRVYWTDVEAGKETLVSAGLDGSGVVSLVTIGLDMPEDLVVEEINRNIYFTDSVSLEQD